MNLRHPQFISLNFSRFASASRTLLLLAMAWAVAASAQNTQRWSCELPSTHSDAQRVYERLQKIVIPRVDFQSASVVDAINVVAELPSPDGGRGVGTVVSLNGNEPPITLHGKAMRFLDVIDSICKQAGLFWWIDPTRLVIANKEAYERSKSAKER